MLSIIRRGARVVMEQIANLSTGNCRQGSNPCLSALKFPNILIINMLGFFIIAICTIIVRSDVKSQKNHPKKFKSDPHTQN